MRRILVFVLLLAAVWKGQAQEKITLEDLFRDRKFTQASLPGFRFTNEGSHYTMLEEGSRIVSYDCRTGQKTATLLDAAPMKESSLPSVSNYEFSGDGTKILLVTGSENIYRRSFRAGFYVWNRVTGELQSLSEKGKQQLATFSPDGEKIAFVRDNNLFIKNLKFGTESQVTFDGQKNKVINGATDWVYEEEFGFTRAFEWSPDSRFLAFIRFDESEVREFRMTLFRGEKPALEDFGLYPGIQSFKYPKAGESNSQVSVRIYDVSTRTTLPADIGKEADIYLPGLKWSPDGNNLLIFRMNRHQNVLEGLLANPFTGVTRPLFTERNEKYIDESFLVHFTFLSDGQFVVLSERDGFSHLYLHDKAGFELAKLTEGAFDVTGFYGYDPVRKLFYYQAASASPLHREVCYVSRDGKKRGVLSAGPGTNRALFSPDFGLYVNYFSNHSTPMTVTLHDWKGKRIRVLEDNGSLRKALADYRIPVKEFFTWSTPENNTLNGWMLRPPGFDPAQKYPVVISQYSGPGSQSVTDSWSLGWDHYLAQEGFIVVSVDPRGTGARGEAFRKVTYLQLGKYESDDLVSAARYLSELPFVDSRNIAIWGWSYGGFTTALTMSKGGELFRAGIAVAPVTNWRFYDNIYTERYMRTPEENPTGYDENSPMALAGGIRGRLLLVHGTADDNVHLQNTMEYAEALVQADIPFDMALYTNRNHSIRGGNTSLHLYRKMTEFLKAQLMAAGRQEP